MFTVEESTLLARMLRVIGWALVVLLVAAIGLGCWEAVRVVRHHHHATAAPAGHA